MDAPTKHNSLATMPLRKTKVDYLNAILCLPDGKRIIVHSYDRLQVWDWESGTQVGEEWEDENFEVETIALSPDGKKIASGSFDGAVNLWNVDTGKVIKTWKGHTDRVLSVSWSPDGERVVSGSRDGMFTVWDVESGKSILGPINTHAAEDVLGVQVVCYSPDIDAKMIATGGNTNGLQIWNAESGELLKTFEGVFCTCLAWTWDGKTVIAGGSKFDTATWTTVDLCEDYVDAISVTPNDRILATASYADQTAQLWDLETNQPIGTPLYHQGRVRSATFSVDAKFLVTCCNDDHIYTWDVSAIVKEAGLPSDILDVTPRPAPKIKGARIPAGFFDDALREANLRIRLSQSHAPPTPTHQRTFNPFTSVLRPSNPHGATESATQSRSRPFSWIRHFSGILRRRDRSDIQLQEVEVPYTAGQPRNYHGGKGKKPVASSSRPSDPHTAQTHSAVFQSTPTAPPATNTSTVSAVAGAPGPPSRPHNTVAVWRARFVRWLCCAPIEHTDGQH
ncbi:WD40 repeat-like protein [Suillus brevipes Sb2]|nr:WD40 repeat-like protein [Suillus brevipes Sb2]